MIAAELAKKIDLPPQESYSKVEDFAEELARNVQVDKETAFKTFMVKMNEAEQSVRENGYYTEEEVEAELGKI